ncbi:MAG: UDP-N-acetylmuramoyl-L-alanyl-D-glutamate--2,6-diaminopimelate ligase [Burkholderiales bacterium]|nr:UDP-N-acetylmuramoyl-L-alanyl-D-glutamate--2,6-diaminopimelate ligase [Burkholderiales bacterium]
MADTADRILAELRAMGMGVTSLATDSRAVAPGDVFLAYPGARTDGRRYIGAAIARGAAAVLWEREGFAWDPAWRVPQRAVAGLREAAGPLAHQVYGRPSERLWTIAVTGTNGKTSCTQWIAQALSGAGRSAAVIGTLGMGFASDPGAFAPDPNTTPDPVVLHRTLARFVEAGARVVALEASSIGVDQGRLNGLALDVALFTNLSRDHLEYHGDLERYAQAKMALFRMPGLARAVLNLDDVVGVRIARVLEAAGIERIGYSMTPGAAARGGTEHHLEAHDAVVTGEGIAFTLAGSWGAAPVLSPLLGGFNVANLLGVAGVLLVSGLSLDQTARALGALAPVAGRMQRVGGGDRPLVVVDYAHSPDALDKALAALADVARARGGALACVFGCGGERDRGKRPLMGEAAAARADFVVVTSDNPRGEDPREIIDEILPGVRAPHAVEPDRRAAIRLAVARAGRGDVVLVAGKGHEQYQEIAGQRMPFSDADEARAALAEWRG